MNQHSLNMHETHHIINKMGKWEDYVEMELENGDSTMEEIYTQFSWGHNHKISYGKYLILCIGEFDTKF